jgi:hypothetical protein
MTHQDKSDPNADISADVKLLKSLGYQQELERRMSG